MSVHPRVLHLPHRRTRVGRALVIAAVLAAGLGTAAAAAPAQASGVFASPRGPVINANFPDPDILQVGKVFHAYATNSGGSNIQHATSTDLVHWTMQPDVAPTLGAWVDPSCTFAPGGGTDHCVWAPDVSAVSRHNGAGYVLYYAARDEASQRQCIGVSTSTSPDGPFTPVGTTPLICPVDQGGAIDASTYQEHGQRYLLWKADGNCCGQPAIIYLQRVSGDGLRLTAPPIELLRNTLPFEGAVVEAPTLINHDGTYVLFYSANNFAGGAYATGYATATSLTGPYTKSPTPLMSTDLFRNTVIGPGGQDVITLHNGVTKIVFHGWDPTYTYRAMYVRTLYWTGGVPHVDGASVRYEAENGALTDARVVPDDSASGAAKVGGLDNPDSSVTVTVDRSVAGPVKIGIRFANGSLDPSGYPVESSDVLSVNGTAVSTVVFAHTQWENWTEIYRTVQLHAGTNTITLTKSTFYAEIDAIDIV